MITLISAATNISWIYLIIYLGELGATKMEITSVTSLSSLLLITSFIWGYLSDKFGSIYFIRIGEFLIALALVVIISTSNILNLILARGIIGLGLAMFIPSMISLMSMLSKRESEKGFLVGMYSASQSLGWASGLFIGGFLTRYFSTKYTFYFALFLTFLSLTLSLFIKKPISMMERKTSYTFNREIFSKSLIFLFLASFLRDGGILGAYSLLPIYLKNLKASEDIIGSILGTNTIFQIPFMLVIGCLLRKFEKEDFILIIGILGTSFTILSYSIINDIRYFYPVQVLLAFSFSSYYVSSRTIATKIAKEYSATILGILTLCRYLGGTLMPILAGIMWSFLDFRNVFIVLSIITFWGFISSIIFIKIRPK